jgi:CRP/FNR family transcriptional regulator, cyclic AMP receptor protein
MARSRRHRQTIHSKLQGVAVFPAGATLFEPDHPSQRIYRVQAGRVRLSRGPDTVLDYLVPGDFFGESCLLRSRRARQAARCLTPTKLTVYHQRELAGSLQHSRRFALQLLRNLALRIDRYEEAIGAFVTEPAERRLARWLLHLAGGRAGGGWVRLELKPSNADLARMIGTTRGRVVLFLKHFQQLGWLRREADGWILYVENLKQFLAG